MNKRLLKLIIASALVAPTASAFAASTASTTFQPSATVIASCTVSAPDLTFGNYDPLSSAVVDATAVISVTCSSGTTYKVGLDAGSTSGATVTTRQMLNGTNALKYGLFTDSTHSTNWDDIGGTTTQSGTGTGSTPQTFTIYGEIPGSQNTLPPGTYADTVTVHVSY